MSGPTRLLIWAALALAVLAVYAPVRDFPFVVYDDKAYVSENPAVLGGLSREGVAWAFTHNEQGNYVPLTWLSHMLDVELFGLDAGRHHTVNALLHLLTALLLFEALRRMTGAPAPSAFVALLFAVHPTHVESVAWIAERRDTLSAFFWMLTLLAYARWADRAGRGRRRGLRYAAVLAAFGLGLLAKPMLVTLPFVLLLLDFWPLRRASEGIGRLLLEKLPLLALAGLVSAAAVWTQGAAGAVVTLEQLPLATRLSNALVSYAAYLGKTLWPVDLAVFYPYTLEISLVKTAAALGLLVALSAAAWVQWRSRPYLAVGWLWYLGTLLPVIGIVQIGSQSMADRYTYLPTIGITIAIAWGAADLGSGRPRMLGAAAALVLGACILLAQAQVSTWRDSVALFEHARAVTGYNHVVHVNLAEAHEDAGRLDLALEHYREALRAFPAARRVNLRMGLLLARRGQWSQAEQHFRESVRRHPEERGARLGLGKLYLGSGRLGQAAEQLEEELALDPQSAQALFHLGEVAALRGEREQAVGRFSDAFGLDPELADEPVLDKSALVTGALAAALARAGRRERAAYWASRALALARFGGQTELAEQLERELASYLSRGSDGSADPRTPQR